MEKAGLSGMQPLLILVVGTPGSGKSFFARQFADSYRFFYIDVGRYESQLDGLKSSNKEVTELAKRLADSTLDQALKCFKHVVVEGPFDSFKEREAVISKASKAGFGTLVVWVQTDEQTAEARALNRDRRRADDRNSLNLSRTELDILTKSFQKPDSKKESFVVVSGKHDFKSQGVIVLKKIAGMYVSAAQDQNAQASAQTHSTTPPVRPVIR